MPIRFRCPECNQTLSIATRMAGRSVNCPGCNEKIAVPAAELQEPTEETRPPETAETPQEETLEDETSDERESFGDAETADESSEQLQKSWVDRNEEDDDDDDDDEFSLRKARTEFDEMDLTPMVDVTFLLLIFFMITASFSVQKSISVPAPDPDKQGAAQSLQTLDDFKEDSVVIDIDADNVIYVDDEPLSDPGDLEDVLNDKMKSESKTELLLTADAKTLHNTVVLVIDAANEVGMQKIRMATNAGAD